jgi:hypothetical protein
MSSYYQKASREYFVSKINSALNNSTIHFDSLTA